MRILILGGTAEARELAGQLVALGHEVTTSLAGRTRDPVLPPGHLRVGKFGGVPGLVAYLHAARIEQLIDATHPYAGLISINAGAASQASGIPLLRLMRAPWTEQPDDNWLHVPSIEAAAAALPSGARAFITTGHEGLAALAARADCEFVVRLIEPPQIVAPRIAFLAARPPFILESELALFRRHGFNHLVTKNSGGSQTSAKLDAARETGVQVVMVDRPFYGPAREVSTVEEALSVLGS